jgi:hypothetical protein
LNCCDKLAIRKRTAVRNIVVQSRSAIDLRHLRDEGRILIVILSKGGLGEGTAHLLYALIAARACATRDGTSPSSNARRQ